jgi:endonuclease YncB( thermonuclease family)
MVSIVLVAVALLGARSVLAVDLVDGLPRVRDDGALAFADATVHLRGVDLPLLERVCEERIRPVRCAPRAVLAVERRVRGFVRCRLTGRRSDGVLQGVCTQERARLLDPPEDLAVRLLLEGLAFARPDAPATYLQLERIARARGDGFWSRGPTLR